MFPQCLSHSCFGTLNIRTHLEAALGTIMYNVILMYLENEITWTG